MTARVKRKISGVLLLDKPFGLSSNAALQKVKRLFLAEKAGHTGNLDPLATGLLPLCLGEATKFSQMLLDSDKTYQAQIKLGSTTKTGDAEGEILTRQPVNVSEYQLMRVLRQFVGDITQIPPMYSALKHQGKALYHFARAGVEIERKPRQITVYSLDLDAYENDELTVTVSCSKGTYIRVLAEDIGNALGCGAHLKALRRTAAGPFRLDQAVTIEMLEQLEALQRDALLLPPDAPLVALDKVMLDVQGSHCVRQGQEIWQPGLVVGMCVRLYDSRQQFMGVGEVTEEGRIAPKRLVVQ